MAAAGMKGDRIGALSSGAAVHNMMSNDSPTFLDDDETLVHKMIALGLAEGDLIFPIAALGGGGRCYL